MGKVIELKKRCPRCGKPATSTEKCMTGKCITRRVRKQQTDRNPLSAGQARPARGGTEIPSVEIVLCEAEAKAVKKNPRIKDALHTIARAAIENYFEGLPKECPKTGKPHRWETNYDETFCGDCHMDVRGSDRSDKGKPYVKEVTLHYKPASGGSGTCQELVPPQAGRKCSECARRLWIPADGVWTDNHAVWKDPPKGFVNCRQRQERDRREAQERR